MKMRHILIHEYCHYRHKDVFWAVLRCILVTVYWFHPFVWAAAVFSKRDCELACDEAAIRLLGEEERLSYGKTLLELITRRAKASDIACMATTMTAGGKSIRERIARIAENPGRVRILLAIVLFSAAALSIITFTQANDIPGDAYLLSSQTGMAVESECFYIVFPSTLDGKAWVTQENNNTDVIVYDRASGKKVGGFYRLGYYETCLLAAEENIYPLGDYGGNAMLRGYLKRKDGAGTGVPGTDSNVDVSNTDSNAYASEDDLGFNIEDTETDNIETMYASGGGIMPIPAPEEVDTEVLNLPYTEGQDLDSLNLPYTEGQDLDSSDLSGIGEQRPDFILPSEDIIVTQPGSSTITETHQYDMGASELYLLDDGSAAVGVFCYLYLPASYEDAEGEDTERLEQMNQEMIALTESDSVKVLLMSEAAMEQILERMVEYRTPYVGASFKVSQLVDSVPDAEGLLYRYMELDTGKQPYGITLHCRMLTDDLADVDQNVCLLDAILLFASVENLDQVTIAITAKRDEGSGITPSQDAAFITYYRADQEERFGELYPCSETEEDMIELYQRVWEELERGE